MKNKSSKIESQTPTVHLLRPLNPRQYRPRKFASATRVQRRTDSPKTSTDTAPAVSSGSNEQNLQCTTNAAPEEIITQIQLENVSKWGLEAEDFDDLNPYNIDVEEKPDPGDIKPSNFEWVTIKLESTAEPSEPPVQIKKEELNLEDIAVNCELNLPPISMIQEQIKTEFPEQLDQIKQEELELVDDECQNMDIDSHPLSEEADNAIETIDLNDEDASEEVDAYTIDVLPDDVIGQVIPKQEEIATICVDDSDDEATSIEASTVHESKLERPRGIPYINISPSSKAINTYEHKCIPRRIYPNAFLKMFIKKASYRGYSVRASRLLNGANNQFTHIYSCDNCDKLIANHKMMKQHVATHELKSSKRYPHLYVTSECQICFQRNLDDPAVIREHLTRQHSDEIDKTATGQKFSVRIECKICRRWFPMNECLECGEKYDRSLGVTWHNQIHRRSKRAGQDN